MASNVISDEPSKDQKQQLFQELSADQDPEITEIESLCVQCRENVRTH